VEIGEESPPKLDWWAKAFMPSSGDERGGRIKTPVQSPVRETILYAEDNRDLRRYSHDVRSEQFNVVLAVDGEGALAKARANPDL